MNASHGAGSVGSVAGADLLPDQHGYRHRRSLGHFSSVRVKAKVGAESHGKGSDCALHPLRVIDVLRSALLIRHGGASISRAPSIKAAHSTRSLKRLVDRTDPEVSESQSMHSNLIGQRFSRLLVIGYQGYKRQVRCDCDTKKFVGAATAKYRPVSAMRVDTLAR